MRRNIKVRQREGKVRSGMVWVREKDKWRGKEKRKREEETEEHKGGRT